ncbi:MAG: glutamate--tRNA ligase [Acidimicrobiaceae bacterium]|nr:glutamate--tRNA ligase [Acidimicrobiaceae bacterium]
MTNPIRTRFAPAPTGFLHVGSARTALFNWLFARNCGGEMWLRIEDTNAALKAQAYVDAIIEPLRWLGIDWDSGPHFQSDRLQEYEAAIERLITSGHAYYCNLTAEEVKQKAESSGLPPGYHGWSRNRSIEDGPGVVVRFRSPDSGTTTVNDLIRGQVHFKNETLEDFVIRRGNGSPTFHLANAVDDHDMGISHVIRGEDLLNTTPRVLLIWEALKYGKPATYAHLPLLVNSKRQKLSKRRDDVALNEYRERGFLPEALVNYLALLGWGPTDGVEIRPLEEIIRLFDLTTVKPGSAFFDRNKLAHFNATYIRSLNPEELAERAEPFLTSGKDRTTDDSGDSRQKNTTQNTDTQDRRRNTDYRNTRVASNSTSPTCKVKSAAAGNVVTTLAADIQQRVTTLSEVPNWVQWILEDTITYDGKAWQKVMLKGHLVVEVLTEVATRISEDSFTSPERIESIVMGVGDELTKRSGVRVLSQAPVRVAVTGTNVGLPLWKPLELLGKDKTLARLSLAIERLRNSNTSNKKSRE